MKACRLARPLVVASAVAMSLALCSATLAADPTGAQRQAMQTRVQELKDRLALTPEQEERLAPLLQERNARLEDLWSRHSADSTRREKRAMLREAKAIQADFTRQIRPILTPEQMREWEAFRKEARSEAIERYRNRQN